MSFMINPFLYGSGGGAPPPGLPPTTYAGLTLWYDGENSPHYDATAVPPGALVAEHGAAVARADSSESLPMSFDAGGNVTRVMSGANGMHLLAGQLDLFDQPSSGLEPSTKPTIADIFSSSAKTLICAVRIDNAPANSGNAFGNMPVFGERDGYFGLHCYRSADLVTFQAYNWDGGADVATVSESVSTWVVIAVKHESGQIMVRKNAGAWATAASGATSNTLGTLQFGRTDSSVDIVLAQLATYNTALTDANLLEVERYFGAKVGITI